MPNVWMLEQGAISKASSIPKGRPGQKAAGPRQEAGRDAHGQATTRRRAFESRGHQKHVYP